MTYNNCSNNEIGIYADYSNNNTITGNTVTDNNGWGAKFFSSGNNVIAGNNLSNNYGGFYLYPSSNNNTITCNTVTDNNGDGISIWCSSNNNTITGNTVINSSVGIGFVDSSNNNTVTGNNILSNAVIGIYLIDSSNNNTVTGNNISNNSIVGVYIGHSSNNKIYLNNFVNNTANIDSTNSTNIWNSTEEITYTYNSSTYTNCLGNHWDDYKVKYPEAEEIDGTGIWNKSYSINSDTDSYPLVGPFENYFAPTENIFDTGSSATPYPSIMGNHTGTIKLNRTITVKTLYIYPCKGTGGHTEYAKIYNDSLSVETLPWEGYKED